MYIEEIAKDEFRICYDLEGGKLISISVSREGIILDLYKDSEPGDPTTIGFTPGELAEYLEEHGNK